MNFSREDLIATFSKPTAPSQNTFSGDWDTLITEEAKKYPNVPEKIVRSLIDRESGGNVYATADTKSKWGPARGLGQFIDDTAKRYMPGWKDPSDSYDPVKNIQGIYAYLSDLVNTTGSIEKALVEYHGNGTDALGTNSKDYARQIISKTGDSKFTPPAYNRDELVSAFKKPEPIAPQAQEQKPSYLEGLKKYYTEDIPNTLKDAAQRIAAREARIQKPTAIGSVVEKKTGAAGDIIAGAPERIVRGVGAVVGDVGEVAGVPVELFFKATNRLSGGQLGRFIEPFIGTITKNELAQDVKEKWDSLPEADKANYSAAIDLMDALGWKTSNAVSKTGKNVEQTGKRFLSGELKIKKHLAERGYGKTIDIKKQNIMNNISKYDLEAPFGNFSKVAENADNMAISRVKKADNLIANAATKAPKTTYVDDVIQDGYSFANDWAALGKRDQAESIINKILSDANTSGLTGDNSIEALVKFKRQLDPDGNLFKLGPALNDADNLERAIRKNLYKQAVAKINEISPTAGRLNREAKELWDIRNIMADASSRIANNNALSLTDRMIAIGTAMSVIGGFSSGSPRYGLGSLALGAATSSALKVAGQGRGAATIMKTGKALQQAGKTIVPNVAGAGAANLSTRGFIEQPSDTSVQE